MVNNAIREEIGDAKYCIIVDEAHDESKKEQMAIVLRFIGKDDIQNIHGQGYDGASNMRVLHASAIQAAEIEHMINIDELETGKGLNQIGTLQRAGDTRWSSAFKSVSSLIKMFNPTCEVLLNIINERTTSAQRGDAGSAYETLTSFEFVFILHLMKEMLEITDLLCQALQCRSTDILNAMNLVSSTKTLLEKFRDDKWDALLANVKLFCEVHNIDVPNMNARYIGRRGRARDHQDDFTTEHYYRVDIFYVAIDSQLQELNGQFNEHAIELLNLSLALDPQAVFESFRIDDICQLVEKFYLQDFAYQEKIQLRMPLHHYKHNVVQHVDYKKFSTISELCQWLVKTNKSTIYQLVYIVITLVLTLSISTTTMEQSFLAMKIVKTRLRNKVEDEFLIDSLVVYIEKEIAENFTTESIIEDFRDMKELQVPL